MAHKDNRRNPEFPFRPNDSRTRAIQSKGGSTTTIGKAIAARQNTMVYHYPEVATLMRYFKTGDPLQALDWFQNRIASMEKNIYDSKCAGKDTFFKENVLLERMLELHKLRFGETHKNINVNIQLSRVEAEKRLYEFIKEQEAKKKKEERIINVDVQDVQETSEPLSPDTPE